MTLNKEFYKENKNGKFEYTTLFDSDIEEKDKEESHEQASPRLQMINSRTFEYKYIKQGSILIKLCRNSVGMNFRFFYIDNMNYALRWFSPNKKYETSYIKLANIVSVKKATKQMVKEFPGGIYIDYRIYHLSIKISYYNDKKKPAFLYIVCKNKLEQKIWLYGLGNMINNARKIKYPFEKYTEYLNDNIYQYSDICNLFYKLDYILGNTPIRIYIQEQSKKFVNMSKKLEKMKDVKDMNDKIKRYITPQLKHSQEIISNVSSYLKKISNRKLFKLERNNITILLFQVDVKYQISKHILKVLSKKYKKQIKKIKQQKDFEKYY